MCGFLQMKPVLTAGPVPGPVSGAGPGAGLRGLAKARSSMTDCTLAGELEVFGLFPVV